MGWQKILAQGFARASDLLEFLQLPLLLGSPLAEKEFRTRVPLSFAKRMQPGNAKDPLLLQVLSTEAELVTPKEYTIDPLGESNANPIPGLIHKYKGRVLLTLTGICAVNCRYCFRRHFPYSHNNPGRQGWQKILDYIRNDVSIHEVILSGGDPLLASDALLEELFEGLITIPHLRTVRFHTRIPVVLPERITDSFLSLLKSCPLRKVMVLHCNHAQEIDNEVQLTCEKLSAAGCHLLNQSVLLKGINDEVDTLVELSERLFDCKVLPYYLHVLDKVSGVAHFDLPLKKSIALHKEMQTKLPGYLVPKLAKEEVGKGSKTLF
jgi:EF-P beta-lysylation protein EpmB